MGVLPLDSSPPKEGDTSSNRVADVGAAAEEDVVVVVEDVGMVEVVEEVAVVVVELLEAQE